MLSIRSRLEGGQYCDRNLQYTVPCHALEQKGEGDKRLDEVLEHSSVTKPSDPCNSSTRDVCQILGNTHTNASRSSSSASPPTSGYSHLQAEFKPNVNKELIFLSLLISKWSLLLISVSCWFGFKDLASYLPSICQKTLSLCGQDKLCWDEVQMNASVVVFGQFSKAAE